MTLTNEDATKLVHQTMPLCKTLGMSASAFSAEEVVLRLDWSAGICTSGEMMHGGTLMALADSAGGACGFLNLPSGAVGTSTIESKTNFFGAVKEGVAIATAVPLHVGSSTIVIETEIRNNDRLVAKVTQTQAVLRSQT